MPWGRTRVLSFHPQPKDQGIMAFINSILYGPELQDESLIPLLLLPVGQWTFPCGMFLFHLFPFDSTGLVSRTDDDWKRNLGAYHIFHLRLLYIYLMFLLLSFSNFSIVFYLSFNYYYIYIYVINIISFKFLTYYFYFVYDHYIILFLSCVHFIY